MAKRTRKQKQRAAARRGGAVPAAPARPATAATTPAAGADGDESLAAPVAATAAPRVAEPAAAPRRRVERVGATAAAAPAAPARTRPGRGLPAGYIQPLDSEDDAAIPFDRVPYVPADLRRVGLIAAIMVVLIIVADIVVSNVVK